MGLSAGMKLGSYEILDPLGAGGMGEVWRGRDTKLGRDVAVKALPDAFALDPERLARFEREAQALAALNHPNLAIIHELKEVDGLKYLILELVDGETLAERINRGPIPLDEALELAAQIARAVGAAHDKGIVHRDLKPANIKVTPQGRAKVLDFGLAKIYEVASTSQELSSSPTMGHEQTVEGLILGTAAYMSPEQARGKEVDRRADVWAFGCVLYEMLTGCQPFPNGETLSDTLAGILVREPDLKALPAATPPNVRALVERCLRKDERRRIRDLGDVRIAIEEARGVAAGGAGVAAAAVPRAWRRRELVLAALAAVFLLAAAGMATRLIWPAAHAAPSVRMDLRVPLGMVNSFYLSPDGRKVAFATRPAAGSRIWVRALDSATAETIPSTEGILTPNINTWQNRGENNHLFWSADSQSIGFIAEDKLKKVAATGGPAQLLASLPAGGSYFGTWGAGGVILLGSEGASGGPLLRVSASGGTLAPATELDASRKETAHRFPHFLPDGRHYLFLATGADKQDRAVYVGALDSKERSALPGIAAEVKYSSGHLLFVRDGALMAQPFDVSRLELAGDAFAIADRFAPPSALTWTFSVSQTGVLAYRPASDLLTATTTETAELSWFDGKGSKLAVAGVDGEYLDPELSPDDKLVAFARGTQADIWWLDIEKKLQTKLTTDPANDRNPRWSPDGKTIAFDSDRDNGSGLYTRAVGVTAADKLAFKGENAQRLSLSDWSPDGRHLAYVADNDIWALPLAGDRKPIQVTKTSYSESLPRISPDSRWIAYVSDKSGREEVYIHSFPEPGVEQQVSTGAGFSGRPNSSPRPRWSRNGKELFYFVGPPSRYMSVTIKPSGTSLNAAAPVELFRRPPTRPPYDSTYSPTADGRFLLHVADVGTGAVTATGAPASGAPPGVTAGIDVVSLILNFAASRK